VKVWIISTSGRRGKLRTIVEGSEHHLQNAEAVTIRADMLASVQRALAIPDVTIILDAVSLATEDIRLSIETVRDTSPLASLVLVVSRDGKDRDEEDATKTFGLTGPYSVIFDEDVHFESVLLQALEAPQSQRVDIQPKKKRFQLFRKRTTSSGISLKQQGDRESKAASSNLEEGSKFDAPLLKTVLIRRIGYALADNMKIIFFSIVLTIAVSVIYFAVTEKGLTFVEIGQYFNSAITEPLKSFFRR